MTHSGKTTLRVAVIQAPSRPGQITQNLRHATSLVAQAADDGARVVVLPELFSCGYLPNRDIWDTAEPRDGQTAAWLTATARRLGIYLGTGTAESNGRDFFNVFVLADPRGQVVGRAYKTHAEASVFRRGCRRHLVDTELGRIGVGICADNRFAAQLRLMHEQEADLILMPHAWPAPARPGGAVSEADVADYQRRIAGLPVIYAAALGIPVVFANQTGPLRRVGGVFGRLMDTRDWRLAGGSRIVDSDGSLLGELGDSDGVLVADVLLDPARKHYAAPPSYSGWLQPGSWAGRHIIIPLDIAVGRLGYALSRQRRRKALSCLNQAGSGAAAGCSSPRIPS